MALSEVLRSWPIALSLSPRTHNPCRSRYQSFCVIAIRRCHRCALSCQFERLGEIVSTKRDRWLPLSTTGCCRLDHRSLLPTLIYFRHHLLKALTHALFVTARGLTCITFYVSLEASHQVIRRGNNIKAKRCRYPLQFWWLQSLRLLS